MALSSIPAFLIGLALVVLVAGPGVALLGGVGQAAQKDAAEEKRARDAAVAVCNEAAIAQLDQPGEATARPAPFPRVEVTTDGRRISINTLIDINDPPDRWMVDCTVVRGRVTAQLYREGSSG